MKIEHYLICVVVAGYLWSGCSSKTKKDPEPKPMAPKSDKKTTVDPLSDNKDPKRKTVDPSPDSSGTVMDALAALKQGDLATAKAKLKGVIATAPDNADAHYWLGVVWERDGENERAEQSLRTALEKKPDHLKALEHLTNILLRGKRTSEAERYVRAALRKNSKDVNIRAVMLKIKIHQKDYQAVIRDAKEIRKQDVDNIRAMIYLAQAYVRLDKLDLALYILQYAKKVKDVPEIDYLVANIYLATKRRRLAQETLEDALRRKPDFPEALNNLAVIYVEAGAFKEAIVRLKRATELQPSFIDAYLNLGNAYRKAGEVEKSQDAYKKALRLNRDFAPAYYNLAILYLESKISGLEDDRRYELAIEYFNRFKQLEGARISRSDPIDKYIEEAKKRIQLLKKQKQKLKRKRPAPKKTELPKLQPKPQPKPEPKPKKTDEGPKPLPLKSQYRKNVDFTNRWSDVAGQPYKSYCIDATRIV